MKRRIFCLFLSLFLLVSAAPPVNAAAEDTLSDCTVQVIYGGILTEQAVKRDAKGVFYAPISWIGYFGPNVISQKAPDMPMTDKEDGWRVFYLKEQEEYGPFARRTYVNEKTGDFRIGLGADLDMQARFVADAKDYGQWLDCLQLITAPAPEKKRLLDRYFQQIGTQVRRINEEYIILTEGKFTDVMEIDGEVWAPMSEVLSLVDVVTTVTGDGKYLCMQPVQDSLLRFLYRRWDELEPLIFGEEDLVGEDFLSAAGWITATATGNLSLGPSGKIDVYRSLFTGYLIDNEAYLAAFDAEKDADAEYMSKVRDNAGEINNIFKQFSQDMEPIYRQIISGETEEMQEFYKSYFKPGKYASTTIGVLVNLGQYAHVYLNQIDDHRKMLDAVYNYKAEFSWPSAIAARSVSEVYSNDAGKIDMMFWEEMRAVYNAAATGTIYSALMGPWYVYFKVGTLFMGDDYQYIIDSSHLNEIINVSQYSFHIFEDRIYSMKLKGLNPNNIRLSLMLSLISSRNAYKTFWAGSDYKKDTIAKIDEILAELYTAGRWSDVDAKDAFFHLRDELNEELKELVPLESVGTVKNLLLSVTDPTKIPGNTVKKEGDLYKGSYGTMTFEFKMGTDANDAPCISYLSIQPNGEDFPFAYDLTTASTLMEFVNGLEDLCDMFGTPLPQNKWKDNWFGPYPMYSNDGISGYEASTYWRVGDRYYQLIICTDEEGDASPKRIDLFLEKNMSHVIE